jgi:hypothetical protein
MVVSMPRSCHGNEPSLTSVFLGFDARINSSVVLSIANATLQTRQRYGRSRNTFSYSSYSMGVRQDGQCQGNIDTHLIDQPGPKSWPLIRTVVTLPATCHADPLALSRRIVDV